VADQRQSEHISAIRGRDYERHFRHGALQNRRKNQILGIAAVIPERVLVKNKRSIWFRFLYRSFVDLGARFSS
jgi:hypothetical protein